MWVSALIVTGSVACAALTMRIMETDDASKMDYTREHVHKAVYWKETASSDTDDLVRFQHLVMAATHCDAVRAMHHDDALERITGMNVARFHRGIEGRIATLRTALKARAT